MEEKSPDKPSLSGTEQSATRTPRRDTSYFWGQRNVPLLYFLFSLIMVLAGFELILLLRNVSQALIEILMVVPCICFGVLLLNSARRFEIVPAEAHPIHYLTRWRRLRLMSNVTLVGSGMLALYAILERGNPLRGNSLEILLEVLGILYLICLYITLVPLRFWSPQPADFARIYLAAMVERPDGEVRFLERALQLFSILYARKTHLRLRKRVFTSVRALGHENLRNLALRLGYAIRTGNHEDAIVALEASINPTREAILTDRRSIGDTIVQSETAKITLSLLAGLAALVVIYISAVASGSAAVGTLRSDIGLLVLGVVTVSATIWAGLRKA